MEGTVTPLIRRYHPYFAVEEVDVFPSAEDCMQLVYRYCDHATDAQYHFYRCDIDAKEISKLIEAFDYEDDLLIRAGSCLYKAHILLETSHTFAEEIYINSFIAFEALIEYLISSRGLTGNFARNEVIDVVGEYVTSKEPGVNFADYEAEMRDGIRNNIIHPYRYRTGERIAQPFLMADYIYEDLAFIDWLFKKILERDLR